MQTAFERTEPIARPIEQWLTVLEQAFATAAIMLYSGGPLNVILSGGYSQGDRQIAEPDFGLTRSLFLVTYLVIAGLLVARWKRALGVIPYGFIIWITVGFAGLSYFWSSIPDETLSSTIALIGTTLFGVYIATRYTPRQQLQLLGWAFGLIVILSLGYAVLLPKYGIMGGVHAGTWRGIYTHKNTLGKMMTLSSTIFTLLVLSDRKHRTLLGIFLSLSVLLLLLSNSKGALVSLITMLGVVAVCQVLRANYRWVVVLLGSLALVVGAIAAILSLNLEAILVDLLGKDLTLTGRTTLWGHAIDMIKIQPWLGYGYEAFWDGMDGPSAYIWRAVKWSVPDAHNGFIELTLHLGLVGLTLFLVGYGINIVRNITVVRMTANVDFIWSLTYLIYIILSNITEQALLKSNNLFWVIYVTVTLTLFMPVQRTCVQDKNLETH
jgi:O-antigen ligase